MAQDEGTVVMADRDVKPVFSFKKTNGRWKIELVNFQKFDEVLTRDVLNAFCRCFVHSDRLTSTTTCIDASEQLHGKDSIAFGRDLLTGRRRWRDKRQKSDACRNAGAPHRIVAQYRGVRRVHSHRQ